MSLHLVIDQQRDLIRAALAEHRLTQAEFAAQMADMVRRPWAYDEADPRFEGKAS